MRLPFAPLPFLLLVFVLGFLLAFVQLGALTIAFDKLGLSPESAFLLLFTSLFGSVVNLPLFTLRAEPGVAAAVPWMFRGLLRPPAREFAGRTLIAVNLGGCLLPVGFSIYLLGHSALLVSQALTATGLVAAISWLLSRPIPGVGIGMPLLAAPLSAALISLAINSAQSAPLAYVSGTLGVLIGADLLRLRDIRKLGTPFASIGGAGTFDGIFLTGIVAVLLA
jgi:uncharacterized membrane protein